MKHFFSTISKKEVLIPIGILGVFFFIFFTGQNTFYSEGTCFATELHRIDSLQSATITNAQRSDSIGAKFYAIYRQTAIIKRPYMELANNYFSFGSSFALVLCVSSVFTFILAFLLAKKGWDNSNLLLKVTFLTFSLITTFNTMAPNVFKNTENTQKNLDRFKTFNKMQYQAYEYLTNIEKCKKQGINLDSIVSKLNMRIPEEQNFMFEVDISKVTNKTDFENSFKGLQ